MVAMRTLRRMPAPAETPARPPQHAPSLQQTGPCRLPRSKVAPEPMSTLSSHRLSHPPETSTDEYWWRGGGGGKGWGGERGGGRCVRVWASARGDPVHTPSVIRLRVAAIGSEWPEFSPFSRKITATACYYSRHDPLFLMANTFRRCCLATTDTARPRHHMVNAR